MEADEFLEDDEVTYGRLPTPPRGNRIVFFK